VCPSFPFTEDELHTLCTEYGIAVCAPCAGPAGVEMILASGGRLRAARLAVHLTEIAAERGSAWVFWLDNDHLGGCLRGAVSAVPVCTVRPASDAV
jgi:hypothetical protein